LIRGSSNSGTTDFPSRTIPKKGDEGERERERETKEKRNKWKK
jgi:hypothetical protein